MAAPLRIALMFLAWLGMAAIYAPILPAGMLLIAPALSLANWQTGRLFLPIRSYRRRCWRPWCRYSSPPLARCLLR